MADFPFVDKYGNLLYANTDNIQERMIDYIIIKQENNIICLYDKSENMFTLPSNEDVMLKAEPTSVFVNFAYIHEKDMLFKEKQTYHIYIVKDADFGDASLFWCAINDILLDKINFNSTQKIGLKNLLVRSE